MRLSMISAAAVAAIVGYGSTIALVLAAATAVSASPAETASWVAMICFAKAAGSALLSAWTRVPVVLAWSTPGAALIAASSGITMAEAVGAFVLAGGLIALTGAIGPLNRAVAAIPAGVASGMLAGVLLPFCLAVATHATGTPWLVLPLVAIFLVVRLFSPIFAVLAALAAGIVLAFVQAETALPPDSFSLPSMIFIAPEWQFGALVGLGIPLYLVTMASQNLPGFAVIKAAGYEPPVRAALGVTGIGSALAGLFGAHTFNMAAITAAICLGDDVHPDKAERWKVGLAYAVWWVLLGLFGSLVIALLSVMPPALIATIAGLALLAPLIGALGAAFTEPDGRFAAAATFVVTASGVSAFGVGAAFWGLLAGLLAVGLERVWSMASEG